MAKYSSISCLSDVKYKHFNARNNIQYPTSSSVDFPVKYSGADNGATVATRLKNEGPMECDDEVMEIDCEGVLDNIDADDAGIGDLDVAEDGDLDVAEEQFDDEERSIIEDDLEESDSKTETDDEDPVYEPKNDKNFDLTNQVSGAELRDLVKIMKCPKDGAETLAAFLKKKSFLRKGVKVTQFRKRNEKFKKLFDWDANGTFVYCNDIDSLFSEMYETTHNPAEWRLFIDGSVKSLKVIY